MLSTYRMPACCPLFCCYPRSNSSLRSTHLVPGLPTAESPCPPLSHTHTSHPEGCFILAGLNGTWSEFS